MSTYTSILAGSLITIILYSISGRLLASILFSLFFWGFLLFFHFECFFVSPLWLPVSICFCVLGRSALSPSLCTMALCSRCLTSFSGTIYLVN